MYLDLAVRPLLLPAARGGEERERERVGGGIDSWIGCVGVQGFAFTVGGSHHPPGGREQARKLRTIEIGEGLSMGRLRRGGSAVVAVEQNSRELKKLGTVQLFGALFYRGKKF